VSNAQTNSPHTILNTQNHRKPKMPRVGNPLELFVSLNYVAPSQTTPKQNIQSPDHYTLNWKHMKN
ncbi:TPA: hypothetical protein I7732_21235, partial [Vibrio vulnificus]|nr:hypothetical protein [Vibrio vulnificus]